MNSVDMVGRLTKDIDLKYTTSGIAIGNFTLAVNRDYTNQNGEREADFISCVIWRKAAENLAKFTSKGSQVGLQGRMQTRNYEAKEGHRVYITELVVEKFHLLDTKKTQTENGTKGNANNDASKSDNQFYQPANPFGGIPVDVDEDDLPF